MAEGYLGGVAVVVGGGGDGGGGGGRGYIRGLRGDGGRKGRDCLKGGFSVEGRGEVYTQGVGW